MKDRFQYCAQLVTACNYNARVVKHGASSAGNWWGDKDGSLLKASIEMIQFYRPSQIRIFLPFIVETPPNLGLFLSTLKKKKYSGGLVLEMQRAHFQYTPCDHLLESLNGAGYVLYKLYPSVIAIRLHSFIYIYMHLLILQTLLLLYHNSIRLVRLRTCITMERSVQIISKFARKPEPPDLYITLIKPFEHHLSMLHGKPHYLSKKLA